jgi:hypothetical protein
MTISLTSSAPHCPTSWRLVALGLCMPTGPTTVQSLRALSVTSHGGSVGELVARAEAFGALRSLELQTFADLLTRTDRRMPHTNSNMRFSSKLLKLVSSARSLDMLVLGLFLLPGRALRPSTP